MEDFLDYLLTVWKGSSYCIQKENKSNFSLIQIVIEGISRYLRIFPSLIRLRYENIPIEEFLEKYAGQTILVVSTFSKEEKRIKIPDLLEWELLKERTKNERLS